MTTAIAKSNVWRCHYQPRRTTIAHLDAGIQGFRASTTLAQLRRVAQRPAYRHGPFLSGRVQLPRSWTDFVHPTDYHLELAGETGSFDTVDAFQRTGGPPCTRREHYSGSTPLLAEFEPKYASSQPNSLLRIG